MCCHGLRIIKRQFVINILINLILQRVKRRSWAERKKMACYYDKTLLLFIFFSAYFLGKMDFSAMGQDRSQCLTELLTGY
jgi:hypothetical protein